MKKRMSNILLGILLVVVLLLLAGFIYHYSQNKRSDNNPSPKNIPPLSPTGEEGMVEFTAVFEQRISDSITFKIVGELRRIDIDAHHPAFQKINFPGGETIEYRLKIKDTGKKFEHQISFGPDYPILIEEKQEQSTKSQKENPHQGKSKPSS